MMFLFQRSGMDELVFEGRNKAYGAYLLRRDYPDRVKRGGLLGIGVFLLMSFSPKLIEMTAGDKVEDYITVANDIMDMPPEKPAEKVVPPLLPKPEPTPPVKELKVLPPRVLDDDKVRNEEPPPLQSELDTTTARFGSSTRGGLDDHGLPPALPTTPPTPMPLPDEEREVKKEVAEDIVEQMPSYPDGEAALFAYIAKNIDYPRFCLENGIQGTAIIAFVIEKDGSISNVRVLRGVKGGELLDAEAMRVISTMPKWMPGSQNGRKVRVNFRIPVKFKLQ